MKKILLFSAGAGLLAFALIRYFKMQQDLLSKFSYRVTALRFNKISGDLVTVEVSIKFMSIADLEAKVLGVYLDVLVDNAKVGFISNENAFVIPAHGSSNIDLTVTFSPINILRTILRTGISGATKNDVGLAIDGFARLKSGFLSTTLPVKYSTSLQQFLKR